jgi:hypothetical protein
MRLAPGEWIQCKSSSLYSRDQYFFVVSQETKEKPSYLVDVATRKVWKYSQRESSLAEIHANWTCGLSSITLTPSSKNQVTRALGQDPVRLALGVAHDRKVISQLSC